MTPEITRIRYAMGKVPGVVQNVLTALQVGGLHCVHVCAHACCSRDMNRSVEGKQDLMN